MAAAGRPAAILEKFPMAISLQRVISDPLHVWFYRLWFSELADRLDLLPVEPKPRSDRTMHLRKFRMKMYLWNGLSGRISRNGKQLAMACVTFAVEYLGNR